jgi:hypothetical protein
MSTNFDASQFVKSKYLKGADLSRGKPVRVTVESVDQHEFPEQGTKLVLKFLEIDQEMILNKTQTTTLIDLFGTQTSGWRGQRINLMQVASTYQGKPTVLITAAEMATDTADVRFGDER